MNKHHGRSDANDKSAAPNTESKLDSAERSVAKLKSGQIKEERKIQVPQRGRGRRHIFCKQGTHLSKKPKLLEKMVLVRKRTSKSPFPGIIKS